MIYLFRLTVDRLLWKFFFFKQHTESHRSAGIPCLRCRCLSGCHCLLASQKVLQADGQTCLPTSKWTLVCDPCQIYCLCLWDRGSLARDKELEEGESGVRWTAPTDENSSEGDSHLGLMHPCLFIALYHNGGPVMATDMSAVCLWFIAGWWWNSNGGHWTDW